MAHYDWRLPANGVNFISSYFPSVYTFDIEIVFCFWRHEFLRDDDDQLGAYDWDEQGWWRRYLLQKPHVRKGGTRKWEDVVVDLAVGLGPPGEEAEHGVNCEDILQFVLP